MNHASSTFTRLRRATLSIASSEPDRRASNLLIGISLALFLASCSNAAGPDPDTINLDGRLSYIRDAGRTLSMGQAYERFAGGQATPLDTHSPDFGVTDDIIWIAIALDNLPSLTRSQAVLRVPFPRLSDIAMGLFNDAGSLVTHLHQTSSTPLRARERVDHHHTFPLEPVPGLAMAVLRVESRVRMQIPMKLESERRAQSTLHQETLTFGLYLGIAFIMASYNLLIFFITRETIYALYSFSVATYSTTVLLARGFGAYFLADSALPYLEPMGYLIVSLPAIALCLFAIHFLQLKSRFPPGVQAIRGLFVAFTLYTLFFPWLGNAIRSNGLFLLALAIILILMSVTVRQVLVGDKSARFLLLAWSGLIAGTLFYSLNRLGILPRNYYTENGLLLGSVAEMTILSLALPVQLRQLSQERELVSQQLSSVKKELTSETTEQESLTVEITNLTTQIDAAKEELEAVNREFEVSEADLIQAEKMAAVGQLIASVTQDIASPVNEIMATQVLLHQTLETLLEPHDDSTPDGPTEDLLSDMLTYSDFIRSGAASIADIHRGFAYYSRPDTNMRVNVDLQKTLEEAMTILASRVQPHILRTTFEPFAPITCRPSEICQAVSNLISNAADAMSGIGTSESPGGQPNHGEIHLSVRPDQRDGRNGILIVVEDSGPGLPEVAREEFLRAFYTTKERGKGTGLGLAITHRITRRHRGTLEFSRSEKLGGAEFRIWFPTT